MIPPDKSALFSIGCAVSAVPSAKCTKNTLLFSARSFLRGNGLYINRLSQFLLMTVEKFGLGTLNLNDKRAGSGQPLLNQSILNSLEVKALQPKEQRECACVLRALDDKIDLNRRMSATLEAMAQALFKSWFVDFDPVKSKAEGRAPEGMDADTAALFPSEFQDSELGPIPKGWGVAELRELLNQRNQRTKAGSQTESIPYVPIECITSRSVFLADYKAGLEAQSSLSLFYSGDVLFGAMRPYFHKVCLAPFDGVTRTTAFVLQPRRKEDTMFSLFTIFQDSTIEYATLHSEGSTIPYAKWGGSLEQMKILFPPEEVRGAFCNCVESFWQKGNQNLEESRNLARLRDALLPRLISGQLRIPEAERLAEAAM